MSDKDIEKRLIVHSALHDAVMAMEGSDAKRDGSWKYKAGRFAPLLASLHQAVENGLKFLLKSYTGSEPKRTHDLHCLLNILDSGSSASRQDVKFLRESFSEARKFYGIKMLPELRYLGTLDKYLNKTGREQDYQTYRYLYETDLDRDSEHTLNYVIPELHTEIARSISLLVINDDRPKDGSVSPVARVGRALNRVRPECTSGDSLRRWYACVQESGIEACLKATIRGELIDSDEQVKSAFQKIIYSLQEESKTDSAIAYLLTLWELEQPAQPPTHLIPVEESFSNRGFVLNSPRGTCIGFARRRLDGRWGAHTNGQPVKAAILPSRRDARIYLVYQSVEPVRLTLNGGIWQESVIVRDPHSSSWDEGTPKACVTNFHGDGEHDIEFWDDVRMSGIDASIGDAIRIESVNRGWSIESIIAGVENRQLRLSRRIRQIIKEVDGSESYLEFEGMTVRDSPHLSP